MGMEEWCDDSTSVSQVLQQYSRYISSKGGWQKGVALLTWPPVSRVAVRTRRNKHEATGKSAQRKHSGRATHHFCSCMLQKYRHSENVFAISIYYYKFLPKLLYDVIYPQCKETGERETAKTKNPALKTGDRD